MTKSRGIMRSKGLSLAASLKVRHEIDPETGCWNWTGRVTSQGYSEFRRRKAHILSYEQEHGPVPVGLELDHLCHNRRCINPDHLEPVTHRVNILRGASPQAINAAKDTCAHGHPFAGGNLIWRKNGARRCRQCDRLSSAAYQRRKRAA